MVTGTANVVPSGVNDTGWPAKAAPTGGAGKSAVGWVVNEICTEPLSAPGGTTSVAAEAPALAGSSSVSPLGPTDSVTCACGSFDGEEVLHADRATIQMAHNDRIVRRTGRISHFPFRSDLAMLTVAWGAKQLGEVPHARREVR